MAVYTLTIKQLMENNVKIFDFDYPFYKTEEKQKFELQFINHFYFYEIGFETAGRFKFALKEKLNLIMPYYNKILSSQSLEQRILDNYDVTETFEKSNNDIVSNNSDIEITTNNENKNLYSDTPKKRIDITNNDYVSNISKDTGKTSTVNNGNSTTSNNSTEQWVRKMTGNIGIQTDADAIQKYEQVIRNTILEILNELEELFMGVW